MVSEPPEYLEGTHIEVDERGGRHLVRDNPICDFCLAENPTWSYPASPMNIELRGAIDATQDDWAACDRCHELLERKDWRTLAVHCLETQAKRFKDGEKIMPILNNPTLRTKALARLVVHFLDFEEHRTGPPTPWRPERGGGAPAE